jgi:hypothetical protein
VKFLIGITPQGTISFVSDCVGGRMSDKEITEQSGLIDHLLPGRYTVVPRHMCSPMHRGFKCIMVYLYTGDVILADRGFTCEEYAGMALAEVKFPPFTRGKKQLEKVDVDWSRELSLVRITWRESLLF